MKKVILVDGNNLMFRSYFATAYSGSIMRNSKGQATNALYGFISMINKIINEENPVYMVVAFDIGKNFRHEKYENYKDGRSETPDDLKSQMPIARKVLDAMGICYVEKEGFEADDIIGTLAKEADLDPEYDALIISSDHDLMQLISNQVTMKMLKSKGDAIYYTPEVFEEEYGFEPIKIIDLKALMGDSSDNIPGVKGIGEKTAKTLIQKYKTLDGVYENIEDIKGKMREKLENDKDNAYFSYELATIYRDVPLDKDLGEYLYKGPNLEEVKSLFQELEFHSFLKNINVNSNDDQINYKSIESIDEINESLEYSYYIECDNENYHYANILGMSMYDGTNLYYIKPELVKDVLSKFKNNLRYTYAYKKNMVLAKKLDIDLLNSDFDAMLIYYLVDGTTKDDLALKMSDEGIDSYYYEDLLKEKVSLDDFEKGITKKAKFIWDQKDELIDSLKENEMYDLYNDIEMPLIKVLASMEEEGIRVNKSTLKEMQEVLKNKIESIKEEIFKITGEEFNISSPKQVGEMLFDKMNIPYPGKKGNSYSTDVTTLEKLLPEYSIVSYILDYRTLNKLYTSYVEPLEDYIKEDGKIHTIYKQTLTRTGRLSSVFPNLQNIPTREEEGRLIKKAFIAEDNSYLLSADYSQIELRILAHISGDEVMINAFNNGDDIHRRVAADIHGVDIKDVTKKMRSTAKHVIFGIVYGISGFGLGENLQISPKEAKAFIEKYYEKYPKVKEYMDYIVKEAYDKKYVTSLLGRRRVIEELVNPSFMVRKNGERIALNTPIQGTGADIIKMAMIKIYNDLKKNNLKSKLLLQIHDEVILNVYEDELEEVKKLVKEDMENIIKLSVPLEVEISLGKDWYSAK